MTGLYNLFGMILKWVYGVVSGLGTEPKSISYFAMTLMAMSILSKLISIPLTYKSTQQMKKTQELQPKLEALKKKYGYDERILQQKTMEFYKENNASAAGCSSCLPLIIQFVIVIALFGVIREPAKYLFATEAEFNAISRNFFWISDLSNPDPFWFALPLINGLSQIAIMKLNPTTAQTGQSGAAGSMKMMMYTIPIMIFIMGMKWASGLLLYWGFGNVIEIIMRLIMMLFGKKKVVEE